MIRGDAQVINEDIKEAYTNFVIKSINHFQMIDKKDIIQGQHGQDIGQDIGQDELLEDALFAEENITLIEANSRMMKKTINVASLDNFVLVNHDISSNDMKIIPIKIDIDLKNPQFKTKGVKPRLKKLSK